MIQGQNRKFIVKDIQKIPDEIYDICNNSNQNSPRSAPSFISSRFAKFTKTKVRRRFNVVEGAPAADEEISHEELHHAEEEHTAESSCFEQNQGPSWEDEVMAIYSKTQSKHSRSASLKINTAFTTTTTTTSSTVSSQCSSIKNSPVVSPLQGTTGSHSGSCNSSRVNSTCTSPKLNEKSILITTTTTTTTTTTHLRKMIARSPSTDFLSTNGNGRFAKMRSARVHTPSKSFCCEEAVPKFSSCGNTPISSSYAVEEKPSETSVNKLHYLTPTSS